MSIREMFSNLTHQFLGMVHKQPPQFEPCLEYLFSVTRAGGHGTGEPGVPGKVPRHLLLFMKPRQAPGSGSSGAEEWKGRRAEKHKDSSSGSGLPSGHTGLVSPRGARGRAKAVAGASLETPPAPTLAESSLDTQRHIRSPPAPTRRVGAGAARGAPKRGRRAPHPRTHLPPVAPAAGSASARTAAGPGPVRSLLPAPPSPRPREVEPAAAPESRGGLPELSRALPLRLLGG